jgi:hypothetical protein
MFHKLDLFLSSGKGKETPPLLGSLKAGNLYHGNMYVLWICLKYCITNPFIQNQLDTKICCMSNSAGYWHPFQNLWITVLIVVVVVVVAAAADNSDY